MIVLLVIFSFNSFIRVNIFVYSSPVRSRVNGTRTGVSFLKVSRRQLTPPSTTMSSRELTGLNDFLERVEDEGPKSTMCHTKVTLKTGSSNYLRTSQIPSKSHIKNRTVQRPPDVTKFVTGIKETRLKVKPTSCLLVGRKQEVRCGSVLSFCVFTYLFLECLWVPTDIRQM